jgi:hypothetical protein
MVRRNNVLVAFTYDNLGRLLGEIKGVEAL